MSSISSLVFFLIRLVFFGLVGCYCVVVWLNLIIRLCVYFVVRVFVWFVWSLFFCVWGVWSWKCEVCWFLRVSIGLHELSFICGDFGSINVVTWKKSLLPREVQTTRDMRLLMEEILHQFEVGSLSHYLQGFYTSPVVVWDFSINRTNMKSTRFPHVMICLKLWNVSLFQEVKGMNTGTLSLPFGTSRIIQASQVDSWWFAVMQHRFILESQDLKGSLSDFQRFNHSNFHSKLTLGWFCWHWFMDVCKILAFHEISD